MAKVAGISESSVGRIWKGHGLKPHRVESFKVSNDPKFESKLIDVIGLYVNRYEFGLPVLKGCTKMTFDPLRAA